MQGYILQKTIIKNQDLILKILTPTKIIDLYRFYGVRHSIIDTGRKIDFDTQSNAYFMPKIHNILQLSYPWEKEYERVYVWKTFISMFNTHLKEIVEIEKFYFELLDWGAHLLSKQHPMRVMIEMYVRLLLHEGRASRQNENKCLICNEDLGDLISLQRAFLFAHPTCISSLTFDKSKILQLLAHGSCVHLSNEEVQDIWSILTQGL